jgi:hypothetical protein
VATRELIHPSAADVGLGCIRRCALLAFRKSVLALRAAPTITPASKT